MSANVDFKLLSMIIKEGDMRTVLKEGITLDHFFVHEARAVFSYLLEYYTGTKTRNLVPEMDLVQSKFPSLEFPEVSRRSTIESLCHEVKLEYLRLEMENVMQRALSVMEEDPHKGLDVLIQGGRTLQTASEDNRDVIFAETAASMKQEYLIRESAKGMTGIPWPVGWGYHTETGRPKILKRTGSQHHPLNEHSGGMQKGEFILFYGRPKSLKTWLLMDLVAECYWHLNQRVLLFTKEMTPQQLRWRIVARIQGVNYEDLKAGRLSEEQREELFYLLDTLRDEEERLLKRGKNRSLLITSGWKRGSVQSGLESLQSKIEEFEPDIVMADSVYLMKATRNKDGGAFWQDMSEIANGLHEMAVYYQIPIVATSQANRKGEELKGTSLAEIAFGDSFGQACDYAIRVIKTEDENGGILLSLVFAAAREVNIPGMRLSVSLAEKFMLDQMFESQRQIMAQFKAEEEIIAKEEEEVAKKLTRKRRLVVDNFKRKPGEGT